ncbi:MAG: glycosyltransferase family 4 protein [Planctomycetota bacterium]|jgi:UDP-GlcNAc:undecaprenyl-phosphate GlcNAc-1-phosphate transferase
MQDMLQSDPLGAGTTIPDLSSGLGEPIDVLADGAAAPEIQSMLDIFHGYLPVFIVAFIVTLLSTPIMRWLAHANGVIDKPDATRKLHKAPVAYLGGAAVFLGVLAGFVLSLLGERLNVFGASAESELFSFHHSLYNQKAIPFSIIAGMTIIMLTGLVDDIIGISPRIKIAGQLVAAAALAMDDVGVKVAQGVLAPIGRLIGNTELVYSLQVPISIPIMGGEHITLDLIYWTGTAIIAIGILGACNASNLIDGLDGLLSGVTTIVVTGLLILALMLAQGENGLLNGGDGILDASRIVLCLAVGGACLGFLPHNFKPASIFLGDAGSQLLGYLTIVIIFTLGDTGRTDLVVAGLIIYALPIIDTTLAIVRRKIAGISISAADHHHLHHMLKRAVGVMPAVFLLYGTTLVFAALGIFVSIGRDRVAYSFALIFASFIGVTAVKIATRRHVEAPEGATPMQTPSRAKSTPEDAPMAPTPDPAR